MKYIMPIVEQLDRAAIEIAQDHPISSRLGLILVDNAVELILHRYCTDEIREDVHRAPGREKYSVKMRKEAHGRFLEGKLALAKASGAINEIERRFIKVCHFYRSELYHVGIDYEGIIRALAGEYYRFACDLFGRLAPSGITHSSNDTFTDVGQRYLDQLKASGKHYPDAKDFAALLLGALVSTPDLNVTLRDEADLDIEIAEENFQFLLDNKTPKQSADALLSDLQFYAAFEKRLIEADLFRLLATREDEQRAFELQQDLRASWKPQYSSLPLDTWRARADNVGKLEDHKAALDEYDRLRKDMRTLEDLVTEAAAGLDNWIESEVDRLRGN